MVYIYLFLFCAIGNVHAKDKFVLSQGTVSLSLPLNWQSVLDLYGMPLTILGPTVDGSRPVISFTPTKLNLKFYQKSLEQNYYEYKNGREEWVKESDGKVLEFFPYTVEKGHDGMEIHRVGYSYSINTSTYFEYSYYILCGEKLFHAKSILKKTHLQEFQKNIEDIVGSFDCK
jgi:hypothetical protein